MEPLIETWEIHNRINLYLLDAVPEEFLNVPTPQKGRNVAEQFAHLHNVRLMWLKAAAPELLSALAKLEKEQAPYNRSQLSANFHESGTAISNLIAEGIKNGKIKNFKPHPTAFVGYLISHESHHRGQIMLTLKQLGHKIDKKIGFGMWEWGSR